MSDKMDDPLVLDLIEWVAREPRAYSEAIAAWRTSCPRLTVWEDAVEQGLVTRAWSHELGAMVVATASGLQALDRNGRPAGRSRPDR